MTIIQKILNWRRDQIANRKDPNQIALSPWDEAELDRKTWVSNGRICGLDIISTPEPPPMPKPKMAREWWIVRSMPGQEIFIPTHVEDRSGCLRVREVLE